MSDRGARFTGNHAFVTGHRAGIHRLGKSAHSNSFGSPATEPREAMVKSVVPGVRIRAHQQSGSRWGWARKSGTTSCTSHVGSNALTAHTVRRRAIKRIDDAEDPDNGLSPSSQRTTLNGRLASGFGNPSTGNQITAVTCPE